LGASGDFQIAWRYRSPLLQSALCNRSLLVAVGDALVSPGNGEQYCSYQEENILSGRQRFSSFAADLPHAMQTYLGALTIIFSSSDFES
jgi:hypothetical protein